MKDEDYIERARRLFFESGANSPLEGTLLALRDSRYGGDSGVALERLSVLAEDGRLREPWRTIQTELFRLDRQLRAKPREDPERSVWLGAYPAHRRGNPVEVEAAWEAVRTAGDLPPLPEMLATLDWQTNSEDWRKAGARFVPYAKNYLRNRLWQDRNPAEAEAFRPEPPPPRDPFKEAIDMLGDARDNRIITQRQMMDLIGDVQSAQAARDESRLPSILEAIAS